MTTSGGGQQLSPVEQRAMRDARIVTQHLAGVPVAQIAATHGLTRTSMA